VYTFCFAGVGKQSFKADKMMTLKFEETLDSAGLDTRSLTPMKWPGMEAPFFSLQTEGTKAVELWERARALTEHTGFWPLIAGEEEHLTALKDNYEMEIGLDGENNVSAVTLNLINGGEALNLDEWLQSRVSEDESCARCDQGDWPIDLPSRGSRNLALTHRYDYSAGSEKPFARVFLLFLPVTVSWQVPAFLRLGGWNQCPQTKAHIAIARAWQKRYGAEIISTTSNIVEMSVNNPPKTKDESLKVAREQFLYCSDLIHRKHKTLSALAATLIDAHTWSFWWT
jgi:hypothetical protein